MISAIGANVSGRRAAAVYPVANVLGVLVSSALFYIINAFAKFSFTSMVMNPFSTALVNTILRLCFVVLLFPLTGVIERVVTVFIRDKNGELEEKPQIELEDRFIAHPALAIEQTEIYIKQMAGLSQEGISEAIKLFGSYSEDNFSRVKRMEDNVDNYEDSIGTYLMKITGKEMLATQSEKVSLFLHTLCCWKLPSRP